MRRSLRNSAALLILSLVCPGCDIQFQDCNGDGFVTWDEIEATIHAHPTLSEMVKEATEVAKGHPIHV